MAQLQTANAATRCLATLQFGLLAINNLLPGEGLQGALHAAAAAKVGTKADAVMERQPRAP
jgi:hypothetical protein